MIADGRRDMQYVLARRLLGALDPQQPAQYL